MKNNTSPYEDKNALLVFLKQNWLPDMEVKEDEDIGGVVEMICNNLKEKTNLDVYFPGFPPGVYTFPIIFYFIKRCTQLNTLNIWGIDKSNVSIEMFKIIWESFKEYLKENHDSFNLNYDNFREGFKNIGDSVSIEFKDSFYAELYEVTLNLQIKKGDIEREILRDTNLKFDVIVSSFVYHHLVHWERVINYHLDCLREGGILTFPVISGSQRVVNAILETESSNREMDNWEKFWYTFWLVRKESASFLFKIQDASHYSLVIDYLLKKEDIIKHLGYKYVEYEFSYDKDILENMIKNGIYSSIRVSNDAKKREKFWNYLTKRYHEIWSQKIEEVSGKISKRYIWLIFKKL